MGTKFPFFNFLVCKTYLDTWACRARRTRGQVENVEHVGHVGHLGHLEHVRGAIWQTQQRSINRESKK